LVAATTTTGEGIDSVYQKAAFRIIAAVRRMIRAVLFDLDDTLFDHRESAADALRRVQQAHDCVRDVPFDEFERQHALLLEELHPEVVGGRMDIDAARRERFRRLFQRFGATDSEARATVAARTYRGEYLEARRPTAGAAALLEAVRRRAAVGIVSNNVLQEQQDKLQHLGLAAHIDVLVVSEVVGVSKPDPRIFAVALDALDVHAEEAVMVGDSWAADVLGARGAGLRAVWFNPYRVPPPDPDLGVRELYALEPTPDTLALIFAR
jgi:putative hydrolase of the HAD superfamily